MHRPLRPRTGDIALIAVHQVAEVVEVEPGLVSRSVIGFEPAKGEVQTPTGTVVMRITASMVAFVPSQELSHIPLCQYE